MENQKNKADLTIHILIIFLTGIYPLFLFEMHFESFAIQHLVLFLCTMGTLFYCVLRIRSGEWNLNFPCSRMDFMVFVLTGYSFVRIVYKIVITNGEKPESFEYEMVIMALGALYFLLTSRLVSKETFKEIYFDILLYCGLIVFAILLWKYFGGEEADCVLAVLLKDRSGISSYTLLICMAGIWQYVRCGDKLRTIFYMGVLITGFLVLLVNQSRLGIWIMVIVFIAVVVVQRPTAELIKRDMTLFSIYLFMLCNMSLLTNYTDLLYADITYDLEQSICLDLLAATGGIIFFNYWSRIPAGMDLKRLVMRKMHRGYCFLLRLICVIFIGVILSGNFWSGLPNSLGMKAVKDFAIPLVDEVHQGKSVFYLCFEQFGVIGSLLILIICVCIISELKKNYSLDKPVTGMLILIAAVFLIQLLFWEGSISALPAYWIYTVLAVSYKEKGEKIISKKMKFEGEE